MPPFRRLATIPARLGNKRKAPGYILPPLGQLAVTLDGVAYFLKTAMARGKRPVFLRGSNGNNGAIVGTATKTSDNSSHGVALLPVLIQDVQNPAAPVTINAAVPAGADLTKGGNGIAYIIADDGTSYPFRYPRSLISHREHKPVGKTAPSFSKRIRCTLGVSAWSFAGKHLGFVRSVRGTGWRNRRCWKIRHRARSA